MALCRVLAQNRLLVYKRARALLAARLGDGSGFVPAPAYLKPDRGKPGTKGAKKKAEEDAEETIIV